MKLGIVIPTYNRQDNLTLCLQALANQRGESSLQVAVWDDGSEDKTKEVVAAASKTLDIRYGWHRHDGYRVSLNRNRGIRLLDPDTTHVWFIDSDVMLNPGAVEHARELLGVAEKFVVVGKYIWLPKMEITVVDVSKRWKEIIEGKLTRLSVLYEENILMRDPRSDGLWRCPVPNDTIRGIALGGNLIVPMFWLRRTGGFDESIVGQGQDCEFGYNLQAAGANAICCEHICGYHLSHYRDQKFLKESVKVTIGYIAKKYGNPIDEKEFLK